MIDAHAHVWRLDRADYGWLTPELGPLYRDHLADELRLESVAAGVERVVLVQAAATHAETDWLLGLATAHDWVAGVVGWFDLEDPAPVRPRPGLVGVRAMPEAWSGTSLADPTFDSAFAAIAASGLTFEALVEPADLAGLIDRVERTPRLRVVVDHGGNPDGSADWEAAMARLGALGAWTKLSGWPTLPWFAEGPKRLAEAAARLAEWYPGRLLWGSDWPVVTLAASYQDWWRTVAALNIGAAFDDAARAAYRL